MNTYYATIFDANYVVRALALYHSMEPFLENRIFAFFCVDDKSASLLKLINLPNSKILKPEDYESEELQQFKEERARGPYCWTLKPYVLLYGAEHFSDVEWLVYIDADMMAFNDPNFGLPKDRSFNVVITPHRFSTAEFKKHENSVGRYNAGFAAFRNSQEGIKILNWWKDLCKENCTAVPEDGMLGDQKYLDDMTRVFDGVYDSSHKGLNTAPWNIQAYNTQYVDGKVTVDDEPLLLYHFQGIRIFGKYLFDLYPGATRIPRSVVQHIYKPYMRAIASSYVVLEKIEDGFSLGSERFLSSPRQIAFYGKRILMRICNLVFNW